MARRVVITGLGIVSCLGNDAESVTRSLYEGRSGITRCQQHIDAGMRSHVAGAPDIDIPALIDRKQLRFMADAAAYAYIAMQQAIADAGLEEAHISNVRTGIIAGSGGASAAMQVEAADILRERGLRRVGPYRVTQTMGSTVSACLATPFKIKGVNYSISSACATSYLCNQLPHFFRRSEVRTEQAAIGIQNDDQCHVGEMVPLGQHLSADQNTGFTTIHFLHHGLHGRFSSSSIAIHS